MTLPTAQQNTNSAANPKLWCGYVHLTSLPPLVEKSKTDSTGDPSHQGDQYPSWLFKYLEGDLSYLFEIVSQNGVALNLSFFTSSKENAAVGSRTMLTALQRMFPHLLGTTSIKPIFNIWDRFWNTRMYEFMCPKPPYQHYSLMGNLMQFAIDAPVPFRILIQFKPLHPNYSTNIVTEIANLYKKQLIFTEEGSDLHKRWTHEEPYSLRIFYQFGDHMPSNELGDSADKFTVWKQTLEHTLLNSMMNYRHDPPTIKECGKIQLNDIIFHSGMGTLMVPHEFDGHFNHSIPLPRTQDSPSDHFIPPISANSGKANATVGMVGALGNQPSLPTTNPSDIDVGTYIFNNIETATRVPFNIHALRQSMSIFGLTRTGKTTFLANMLHDIALSNPQIGQLIFYLKNEKLPFDADIVLDGNSNDLAMPYIFAPNGARIRIEEFAGYIASGLGLLDNGRRYVMNYFYELQSKVGAFPKDIGNFLKGVLHYLENPANRYGEAQGDIYQATKQRIEAMVGNPMFTRIYTSQLVPQWFQKWMTDGKKVVIDLQMFNPFEQRFLVLSILQMIRIYAKPAPDAELHRLYVVDEAHRLFYRPTSGDHYDSDNLGQFALDKQLDVMINELANCGIGGIFADQNPYKVLDSIRNQIGTSVLFRISRESAQFYSQDPNQQKFHATMPDHTCFIESNPQCLAAYVKPKPPFTQ